MKMNGTHTRSSAGKMIRLHIIMSITTSVLLLSLPRRRFITVPSILDPRFLYHVEEESVRFRVGDSSTKSREEKDEMRYSNGDEEDESVQRPGSLIQPFSAGWEQLVDDDEEKSSMDDRHKVIMIANTHGNVVSSSQCNTQAKPDFAASVESLKSILSHPVTGALMSDAAILPCGHSFGAGGLKQVQIMKACYTCSQPTSEGSEKPNLSLRIVVHAFCQEEESHHVHSLKRRKERSDHQHKRTFCITDTPKSSSSSSRGIQFPFSIGDQIIIEGNKRTPPRFVGRKAVIMTHCLNGWYVVKTLDNAESIKLQHCSLAKIPSDNSPSEATVAEMAAS